MAQSPPQFHLNDFLEPGNHFHIARQTYRAGERCAPHTHDFCEIFWIEQGQALHTANDQEYPLRTGAAAFIRAADIHSFRARSEGFTLVNIAFATEKLTLLQQRYFAQPANPSPWNTTPQQPKSFQVSPDSLQLLERLTQELPGNESDQLAFDTVLLQLHLLWQRSQKPIGPLATQAPLPRWLEDTLKTFAAQDTLPAGTQELMRRTGRSPEHVSRVIRKAFDCPPTELANRVRMERAATRLAMTNQPIVQIAGDCGIDNLGYFYRLFKSRFGTTPRQYRLQKTAVVRA